MSRTTSLGLIALYLIAVPAGLFFWLTTPGMGYNRGTAGVLAGLLALAGVALIPVVLRRNPADSQATQDALPAKGSWGILIGFLVAVVAVLVYFGVKDE